MRKRSGSKEMDKNTLLEKTTREIRAVKVIGLGGIGARVAEALVQYLSFWDRSIVVSLIDGDEYEERNRKRVLFEDYGNKAVAKAEELADASRNSVVLIPVPDYVTPKNVRALLEDGDVVFLCVDNHATRRLVSNRCRQLDAVVLFSGGNDGIDEGRPGTYGNVQVYIREDGHDVTNPLTRFHPEIAKPADKRPDELGCAASFDAAPQLLFTNIAVASSMLGAFYAWLTDELNYEEIYLDIALGQTTPVQRATTGRQ